MPASKHAYFQAASDRLTLSYLRIKNFEPKDLLPKKGESAQGMVEYALILVLVAVVVIVILALLGPQISRVFGTITCYLASPPGTDLRQECFEWATPTPPPAPTP